jgi:hypothetical protein
MRRLPTAILAAIILTFTANRLVRGMTIIGTPVGGCLDFAARMQNYFDPVNGWVPESYLNFAGTTVAISDDAVEFGFADETAEVSANFTGTQLIITDHLLYDTYYNPFQMLFTNCAVTSLALVSDTFPSGGITNSLSGSVITLNWAGGDCEGESTFQAVFDVTVPPGPLLRIQLTSTNSVLISWPASFSGYTLQQNRQWPSANWLDVMTKPEVVNGENRVTVSPPVHARLYRLNRQ